MNEIKNLLAENRKALQGLHAIANMDFEKPFIILERTGKFTYNSIMKELGKPDAELHIICRNVLEYTRNAGADTRYHITATAITSITTFLQSATAARLINLDIASR